MNRGWSFAAGAVLLDQPGGGVLPRLRSAAAVRRLHVARLPQQHHEPGHLQVASHFAVC